MKRFNRLLFFISLLILPISIYSLTLDFTVSQRARLDVQVYLQQPTNTHSLLENGIARYSLAVAPNNDRVFWWQAVYQQSLINPVALESIFRPEDHIKMPILKRSPFSIELTPEAINDLADADVSQIYLVISQRTYSFDGSLRDKIRFFKRVFLMKQLVNVDQTITIQASGIINPEKFDKVPTNLKSQYPEATGSAS